MSAEVIAMGTKAGLNPRQMCDIINAGSGRNAATQDKFPRSILPGTFDFGFATGLSYKDVRLCLQEADAQGVPMPVGAEVFQVLGMTKARYGADSDFTCIAKRLRGVGRRRDARLSMRSNVATADRSAATPHAPLAVRMAHALVGVLVRALVARGRRESEALRLRPAVLGARGRRAAVEPAGGGDRARATPAARRAARAHHRHAATSCRFTTRRSPTASLSHGLVRDDMHVGSVSHLGTVLVPALLVARRDDDARAARISSRRSSPATRSAARSAAWSWTSRSRRSSARRAPSGRSRPPAAGAKLLGLDAEQDDDRARARREHGGRLQRVGRHGRQRDVLPQRLRRARRRDGRAARGRRRVRVAHRARRRRRHARGVPPAAPADVPELFADRPEILAVFFKPVPACNFAQTPAQVALALAQRRTRARRRHRQRQRCASRKPRRSTPAATRADRSSTSCKRR